MRDSSHSATRSSAAVPHSDSMERLSEKEKRALDHGEDTEREIGPRRERAARKADEETSSR